MYNPSPSMIMRFALWTASLLLILSLGLATYCGYELATYNCIRIIEKEAVDIAKKPKDSDSYMSEADFHKLQGLLHAAAKLKGK